MYSLRVIIVMFEDVLFKGHHSVVLRVIIVIFEDMLCKGLHRGRRDGGC